MARRIDGSTVERPTTARRWWRAAMALGLGGAGVLALVVAALGPIVGPATPAHAACSDVAAPEVYWRRCLHDGQVYDGVDLTGAVLRDASFKRADLSGSTLENVDARGAKFVSAVLQGTNLDGANLIRADLTNADLSGASLRAANLNNARLFHADFHGADLTGARLEDADMHRANFAGATWIDGKTVCAEGSIGQCNAPRATDRDDIAGGPSG